MIISHEYSHSFTEDLTIQAVLDMFAAGLETTVGTLRWALLYLTRFPDIQTRLHREVDQVLSPETLPTVTEKQRMPYTEAFVMELLRHSHVAAVGIMHTVTRDTYLDGYVIPNGSTIIPNIASVLKDPDNFKHPEEFNPERFLDEDGSVLKHETFIPFSIGKSIEEIYYH